MDIDDIRPDRPHRVIIQAEPFQRLAAHIGYEDIGLGQQLADHGVVVRLLQVKCDRALAVIEAKEGG